MTTNLDRETHLSTLQLMRDDMQRLVDGANGLDRRRIDRHQLAALAFALEQLRGEAARDAAARARARPGMALSVNAEGDVGLEARNGMNIVSLVMHPSGSTVYAWHEAGGTSGHGDAAFVPSVYELLRTLARGTT